MGQVVSFPRTKDKAFVWRQAQRMVDSSSKAAEKWLAHILDQQREAMERKGIDIAVIDEQLLALEAAILAKVTRLMLQTGGVA